MEHKLPIKAIKSQFMERWSNAECLNRRLVWITTALCGVCVILTIACVYMVTRPRPIYYIPGIIEAGSAKPESIPLSTVASFVSSWVLSWSNFTPQTVESVYLHAGRYMSPRLAASAQARLNKDVEEVKHSNISSLLTLNAEPQVQRRPGGFLVTVEGIKGIYVGKEEIKEQRMVYRVGVRHLAPTAQNPYGLLIDEIDQEVL